MGLKKIAAKLKANWLVVVLALLVLSGAGVAGYFGWQNYRLQNDPKTAQEAQSRKDADLLNKVGKIYNLPTDETPVLGTVDDKEKLKDQPFFKDAQNGDRLIIYAKAKKAVIYRESDNRIINAGPIAITSDASVAPTTSNSTTTTKK